MYNIDFDFNEIAKTVLLILCMFKKDILIGEESWRELIHIHSAWC